MRRTLVLSYVGQQCLLYDPIGFLWGWSWLEVLDRMSCYLFWDESGLFLIAKDLEADTMDFELSCVLLSSRWVLLENVDASWSLLLAFELQVGLFTNDETYEKLLWRWVGFLKPVGWCQQVAVRLDQRNRVRDSWWITMTNLLQLSSVGFLIVCFGTRVDWWWWVWVTWGVTFDAVSEKLTDERKGVLFKWRLRCWLCGAVCFLFPEGWVVMTTVSLMLLRGLWWGSWNARWSWMLLGT